MTAERTATTETGRPLRRDAQRNRETILAAARIAFAEQGINASLEGIARRAGVAIGTLYRHFPRRLDLMQAIFDDKLEACVRAGERALTVPDAWVAFTGFLERIFELQAQDRGLNDLLSMTFRCDWTTHAHERLWEVFAKVVARAHQDGRLRPDITAEDLALVVWSHTRVIEATRASAPHAWRRHLALTLDGFRSDRARPLPEPPMTAAQVRDAMAALGESVVWR
ncbi:helix-turn-helix domain-containing protein [Streptomyces ziwulingensis]|uniref:Helix-turn-helix domain-containing protein n=1 Tax=Streptomyces ziwulingensis TaxID=1045501 RepID=A0ABP9BS24_9ACTN